MELSRACCQIQNQKWVSQRAREWRKRGPAARSGMRNRFRLHKEWSKRGPAARSGIENGSFREREWDCDLSPRMQSRMGMLQEIHQRKNSEENIFQTKVFQNSKKKLAPKISRKFWVVQFSEQKRSTQNQQKSFFEV
jgi:hypothetical protein